MSWEAAMAAEKAVITILTDHAVAVGRIENTAFLHAHTHGTGSWFKRWFRWGFHEGVAWTLHMQSQFAKLPAEEQIAEFDKGEASLYWPLLKGDEL